MSGKLLPISTLFVYLIFFSLSKSCSWATIGGEVSDRIVISAPVLIPLYLGDNYLAANIEAFRVASTGLEPRHDTGQLDGRYLLRSHEVISQLNPCHEDNYYLANAILAFGGGDEEANGILKEATECRFWDFLPPFLYGFNKYFFANDAESAVEAFEIAASRSPENRVLLQRLAITIQAEELDDSKMALEYLIQQRDAAKDAALKESLNKRIGRLEGLIVLESAQERYEEKYDRPLEASEQLLEYGILESMPEDPLQLGYEFKEGEFRLRQVKIRGLERSQ